MKMKVLSPAGDFESLKMAVYNGADEVYLGIKDFNARNNIEGFNLDNIKEAIDFAHIFDVKVFVTVNILFNDDELQSALDLCVDCYNLGADALIVQDYGLIYLLHKFYPEIELHASTQMGIHNLEGVLALKNLGFKRVVLARETPLDEVKRIKDNVDIEIEYFVQGALCVSFSGNCYLSSYKFNASGNRGKCKQLCRLPYSFYEGNKKIKEGYLLSAKDMNMLEKLKDFSLAGIDSLKIEGRARRPYYVGVATKMYRTAVDNLNEEKPCENKFYEEIKLAFNRGYTCGYLDSNKDIISKYQNHIGIKVGKVLKVVSGNKFNEIYISSNRELSPKSVLKFFNNDNEMTTISAFDLKKVKEGYKITTTQKIQQGYDVNLISDFEREKEIQQTKTKRNIEIKVIAREEKPIEAQINLNGKILKIYGNLCQKAIKMPIKCEELQNNFKKSEIFDVNLNCELDEIFLPKQQLNEFRRNVFDAIKCELTKLNRKPLEKRELPNVSYVKEFENFEFTDKLNKNFKAKNIVYSPEFYNEQDILNFVEKIKDMGKIPYLDLPNFALKNDVEMLKNIVEKHKISVVVNNPYALNFDTQKVIGGGLNIYNSYAENYFNLPFIRAEKSEYKMPYMTLRHCPIKEHVGGDCSNCKYNDNYYYKMQNGSVLKLKRKKLSTCTFYLTD